MAKRKTSPGTALTSEINRSDPHTKAAPPLDGFPVLSPVLQVLSMSVVVFTRHRFGYAYLKPASLFLTLGLALVIFAGFAWTSRTENHVWLKFFPLIAFSFTWLIAYFYHCFICHIRQWIKKAPLDNASGISFLGSWPLEMLVAFAIGAWLFYTSQRFLPLGTWLMTAAAALGTKEALNSWYYRRIQTVRATSEGKSETLAGKKQLEQSNAPIRKPSKSRRKKILQTTPPASNLSGVDLPISPGAFFSKKGGEFCGGVGWFFWHGFRKNEF